MCTVPFANWISNAAARFSGIRGAVSIQARQVGCSRQAIYDQAQKVHGAVQAAHSGGLTREELIRENQALRSENAQLWEWVDRAVEITTVKQQKFSAEASSMGHTIPSRRSTVAGSCEHLFVAESHARNDRKLGTSACCRIRA